MLIENVLYFLLSITFFIQASKKHNGTLFGRNDTGLGVVFPESEVLDQDVQRKPKPGDYVQIQVEKFLPISF